MDRAELEKLDRESLVLRAQAAGIKRARVLTRPELVDELVRLDPTSSPTQLKRSRGFFGIARDLLSRVVERGLHLPDAAERFRQALVDPAPQVPRPEAQAIPTVTLAEIYAAQGHKQRAIDTLKRVLEAEPDHAAARALLEKLEGADYVSPPPVLPPEPDYEPAPPTENEAAEQEEAMAPTSPERVTNGAASDEEPISEVVPSIPAVDRSSGRRDRCVAVGSYVWWQLSPASHRLAETARFFLRVVTVEPSWDGPRIDVRDLAVDPATGETTLGDLPPNAVVRVAIGFMADGELVPVAHSPALHIEDGVVREWTFGEEPTALEDPLVRAAVERADRLAHV